LKPVEIHGYVYKCGEWEDIHESDYHRSWFRVHQSHVNGGVGNQYLYGRIIYTFVYTICQVQTSVGRVDIYPPAAVDKLTNLPVLTVNSKSKYATQKYMLLNLIDAPVQLVQHPDLVFADKQKPGYSDLYERLKNRKFVLLAVSERVDA